MAKAPDSTRASEAATHGPEGEPAHFTFAAERRANFTEAESLGHRWIADQRQ
jgi:hypothetical protein